MPTATSSPYRAPDWNPLERALAAEFGTAAVNATAAFWFIGFVAGPDDVGELRIYEHTGTRRQVTLDHTGGAFRWFPEIGSYSRMSIEDALVEALA